MAACVCTGLILTCKLHDKARTSRAPFQQLPDSKSTHLENHASYLGFEGTPQAFHPTLALLGAQLSTSGIWHTGSGRPAVRSDLAAT
eukprot:914908-Rhodomonas_salina.5